LRVPHLPVVQLRLRNSGEFPVVAGAAELGEADRHVEQWGPVFATGFQQQHGAVGVSRQAVGNPATGCTGADDHIIVVSGGHGGGFPSRSGGGLAVWAAEVGYGYWLSDQWGDPRWLARQ